MVQSVPPRLVKASTFLAWWRRMIELEQRLPDDMTDVEWRRRGQPIRVLLSDLVEVGQVAGAVLPGDHQNPDFDWRGGEIDMQGTFWASDLDRATGLIARLVKWTGIPE